MAESKHSSSTSKELKEPEAEKSCSKGPDKQLQNVLTRMRDASGPMSRLEWCRVSGQRVSVFIRSVRDMCAICRGRVLLFDKHWNMVLRDVEQSYIPRLALQPHLLQRDTPRRATITGTQWEDDTTTTAQHRDGTREPRHSHRTQVTPPQGKHYHNLRQSQRHITPTTGSAHEDMADSSLSDQIRTKSYKQLFIRGDNIALVSLT